MTDKVIRISDEEQKVGTAKELPPKDRVRLYLASYMLGGLAVLLIGSGVLLAFAPADHMADVRDFFTFVKAFVPPLVTLIIGFYFTSQSSDS